MSQKTKYLLLFLITISKAASTPKTAQPKPQEDKEELIPNPELKK